MVTTSVLSVVTVSLLWWGIDKYTTYYQTIVQISYSENEITSNYYTVWWYNVYLTHIWRTY